ncbi:competence protein ComEA [Noviherbaspirillum humi]|uniref:Competence protein ComEA n=1 Tax=Noviherbaspirillum humi TaxID=1688639 RepID=A0A239DYH7_9BURK|nr:helix-hairpin-helix domain-containing protein [Noviherbaspirillum humi]SNS37526.1 competence protein ComEA [Noviherbaspirillum humi]
MIKKLLLTLATFIATMSFAFAQVDVNKADQAALDGIRGIGPAMSKRILDERKKGGDFKDWDDLQTRVKGIGEKNAAKLSAAGLNVNGQAKSGASASAKEHKKSAKGEGKRSKSADMAAQDGKTVDAKDMKPASADAKEAKKGDAKK